MNRKRTHSKLNVNSRVRKDDGNLDGQSSCTRHAPGELGVLGPASHQHILEIRHPCFARSGRAVDRVEGFSIALDLTTPVRLKDAAKLEWSMVILELRLEADRVYHMRSRSQSRDDVGSEESMIFGLEVLRVGGPIEEGLQRVARSRIPECNSVFSAVGCLGCVRYDRSQKLMITYRVECGSKTSRDIG